jgi:hypothetical protein
LTVGEEVRTRELEVLKDPGSAGSEEDVREQTELLLELRSLVDRSARMINEIEWARKGIDDLEARLGGGESEVAGAREVLEAAADLDRRLRELEGEFFDLRLTGALQDSLRWKRLLYAKLFHLAWSLGRADFPPTGSQLELFRELEAEVGRCAHRFDELRGEVGAFGELLREKGAGGLRMRGVE